MHRSTSYLKFFSILFFLLIGGINNSNGQGRELLLLSDNAYQYIERLQKRGFLLDLNPTALPYTYSDVSKALKNTSKNSLSELENKWFIEIEKRISRKKLKGDHAKSIEIQSLLNISDTKRLNTLEPLRNDLYLYPEVKLRAAISNDFFVGSLNLTHSYYYDQDPDGIDSGDRLYIRPEDSYMGLNYSSFNIYLGRFDQHWGSYGNSSTVLSSNARSFDRFKVGFSSKYISIESMIGELDNLSSNRLFEGKAFETGSQRRYIAAHRIDWRPNNSFTLTYFESVIYSGYNSGLSPKFMNPLLAFGFVSSNSPINDNVNLLMGLSTWWHYGNLTIDTQIMLDDIHVEDKEEVTTFSAMFNFNVSDLIQRTDIGFSLETVAYQTYNAPKASERYLYLKRGIATQNTDYVLGRLYTKVYLEEYIKGLTINPSITYYLQGEQIINQPIVRTNHDGSLIDIILTGKAERTFRGSVNIFYNPHPNIWLELDTGYYKITNFGNIANNNQNRFATILRLGFRFGFY